MHFSPPQSSLHISAYNTKSASANIQHQQISKITTLHNLSIYPQPSPSLNMARKITKTNSEDSQTSPPSSPDSACSAIHFESFPDSYHQNSTTVQPLGLSQLRQNKCPNEGDILCKPYPHKWTDTRPNGGGGTWMCPGM